jgi:hypothetical protein
MIDAVKAAFIERLDKNSWLDETTREASKEKVRAITKMIAFPDQLYNDTYLNNLYAAVSGTMVTVCYGRKLSGERELLPMSHSLLCAIFEGLYPHKILLVIDLQKFSIFLESFALRILCGIPNSIMCVHHWKPGVGLGMRLVGWDMDW